MVIDPPPPRSAPRDNAPPRRRKRRGGLVHPLPHRHGHRHGHRLYDYRSRCPGTRRARDGHRGPPQSGRAPRDDAFSTSRPSPQSRAAAAPVTTVTASTTGERGVEGCSRHGAGRRRARSPDRCRCALAPWARPAHKDTYLWHRRRLRWAWWWRKSWSMGWRRCKKWRSEARGGGWEGGGSAAGRWRRKSSLLLFVEMNG